MVAGWKLPCEVYPLNSTLSLRYREGDPSYNCLPASASN
jgi:hypothetical protein